MKGFFDQKTPYTLMYQDKFGYYKEKVIVIERVIDIDNYIILKTIFKSDRKIKL